MTLSRRSFNKGMISLALAGLASRLNAAGTVITSSNEQSLFTANNLIADSKGVLDLPQGFKYKIISQLNNKMDDGMLVPDRADGMGCFAVDNDRVALVRNHEIRPDISNMTGTDSDIEYGKLAYDSYPTGKGLPGGTSNIVYNIKTETIEKQYMSLLGTIRNCAGGITPWGSWLTCEEDVSRASEHNKQDHGYVFEIPADANGLVEPKPIKAMGRFNHEAACVDPKTGVVYLTEDRHDSLFYRFIPNTPGKLHDGGILQALVINEHAQFDTRNWENVNMPKNKAYQCSWIDMDNIESPDDDLRARGFNKGAAVFARGEGIIFSEDADLYFTCTNGGKKKLGQIMRYTPSQFEGTDQENNAPGTIELFVESAAPTSLYYADNIVIAPSGHMVVCEDRPSSAIGKNFLKLVSPSGNLYDFARIRWDTEPAGACFSPDGSVMFVNLYSPTATLAITGPWDQLAKLS